MNSQREAFKYEEPSNSGFYTAVRAGNNSGALNLRQVGPSKDSVIAAFLAAKPGLELVEERVRSCLSSDAKMLTEISAYLLDLGGKRVRPVLALLTARLLGLKEIKPQLIDVAAGIELIHMATLLHDDIIDESPIRRRKQSAFARFGLPSTLLAGDFLLVKAFGLCARLDRFIVEETERACVALTEGEIIEGKMDLNYPPSLQDYTSIISKKTASLFSLATTVGAHLAETSPRNVALLNQFGHSAGLVFQMVDDILDITADEDLLGKPTGMDLRQKTPSLINILWLARHEADARAFFSAPVVSTTDVQRVAAALRGSSIVQEARELAKLQAKTTLTYLEQIEDANLDTETLNQLSAIVDYTLERCL